MNKTTGSAALLISDPSRFDAWCDTCAEITESHDTTCRHCLQCGDRRENHDD